jgi:hypothetical protein
MLELNFHETKNGLLRDFLYPETKGEWKKTIQTLQEEEEADDGLMLSLFLDFLTKDALKNSDRLEAYTEEMSQEDDELLAGVEIDP